MPTHVPAYLSLKLRMKEDKVTPYIVLDAGYLLDCLSARRKFYFSPSVGINIATRGKVKINLGLGLASYKIEYESGQRLDEDLFLIKLGLVF